MKAPPNRPPGSAQVVEISREDAGQRVDNFLLRVLKGVPRSRIYRILRKGEVRVNKGRVGPHYRLVCGDKVRVPPIRLATQAPVQTGRKQADRAGDIEQAIIYEDQRLLVIDKPSGLAVHGGSGVQFGVIERIRAARPDAPYLELVHRLDRDTSGCLLIAKRRSELRNLHELLRTGGVQKRYLALLQGAWKGGERTVNAALLKQQGRGGERVVAVSEQGKAADTRFVPLQKLRQATLVEVDLGTGRTHQIRVHAAHIGHPLAGDEKYGDRAFNRQLRELGLKRLFLHAHSLAFTRDNGDEVMVNAPLPPVLRDLLDRLEPEQDRTSC